MILKLFTQPHCPKCPAAKALVRQLKIKIEEFDTTTVDGLAEASFYSIMGTPSLILCDNNGKEICGWRGEVPSAKAVLAKIK